MASWSPWLVGDREKVWRRAVGMVSNLRGRSYEDRMAEVGMTSLLDKRVRGNMIATYRIMTGKDMVDPRTFFDMAEEWAGPRTRLVAGVHNIRTVLGVKIGYDECVGECGQVGSLTTGMMT